MIRFVTLAVVLLLLNGCGFHLRGTQSVDMPDGYQALRFEAGGFANTEIAALIQNALVERAGVRIKNDTGLPMFILSGELFERRVLSVNVTTGAATDYLLIYRLTYGLRDAKGRDVMPSRQVYLQRDLRYDSTDALGMERESERLQNEMRLSAVDRVVQQLGHLSEVTRQQPGSEATK